MGLGGGVWLDLGWSVVPLQETPESARFSLVAPIAAVRWWLLVVVGGGIGGVDGLLGEVESAGGDDVVA